MKDVNKNTKAKICFIKVFKPVSLSFFHGNAGNLENRIHKINHFMKAT